MNWGRQMVAAAYCVSAVTKTIASDGLWFLKGEQFVLSAIKAQEEMAVKSGESLSESATQFAYWLAQHPLVSCTMLLVALLLELGAPLMLLNRRIALVMGLSFCLFHAMNGWFMGLDFPLNRDVVIVVFINVPFWLVWGVKKCLPNKPPGVS